MKKLVAIFLLMTIMLIGCSSNAVSQEEFDSLSKKYTALKKKYDSLEKSHSDVLENWESIKPKYEEYLEQERNELTDLSGLRALSNCITENASIYRISDSSAIVVVPAEGRTLTQIVETISKYASMFPSMLRTSELENCVLLVLTDQNEVWFGYTITNTGESTSFLSEKYD